MLLTLILDKEHSHSCHLFKAAFPVVDTESIVVSWSRENENRAGNIA